MKVGIEKPIPKWIKNKMPCGIERLNTIGCKYYGIIGLSRKVRDWYSGMFMEWVFDRYEADYVLDLVRGVYWRTGRDSPLSAKRIEDEYANKRRKYQVCTE